LIDQLESQIDPALMEMCTMQPNSTNGVQASAHDMLESLRLAIEKLETELRELKRQNEELKKEKDEYRKMLADILKPQMLSREEWEQFNPDDFKLTIDDLLAVIDEYKE
jgi:predicted RNase H-like nuclease (RuvC/YqgF family)